jgi:hypothetical protein
MWHALMLVTRGRSLSMGPYHMACDTQVGGTAGARGRLRAGDTFTHVRYVRLGLPTRTPYGAHRTPHGALSSGIHAAGLGLFCALAGSAVGSEVPDLAC